MVDEREVIRCPACGLNQFMTTSRDCRKCKTPVDEILDVNRTGELDHKSYGRDIGEVFMDNILSARSSRGWSQRKLASRMGVSQQLVSSLETSSADPQLQTIQRFAEAFGVPAYTLLVPVAVKEIVR